MSAASAADLIASCEHWPGTRKRTATRAPRRSTASTWHEVAQQLLDFINGAPNDPPNASQDPRILRGHRTTALPLASKGGNHPQVGV